MSRPFRFKRFTVIQEKAAMKVCTDACLLGAYAAQRFEGSAPKKLLDIGAGTGLLSLMLAQKINGKISAIEIDATACAEAGDNFNRSPFSHRLNIICGDVRRADFDQQFNLIVCNPPFYENDLESPDAARAAAMHNSGLSFADLAACCARLLEPAGSAVFMVSSKSADPFIRAFAGEGLFANEVISVAHSPAHLPLRVIFEISRKHHQPRAERIDIHKIEGGYSAVFEILLKDYYLNL